ncbi:hypothetical protein DIPPA_08323 [Diplonema papillatum]|nr:hypothetical protein DIPPA_08323 [Diplonema papillatum]
MAMLTSGDDKFGRGGHSWASSRTTAIHQCGLYAQRWCRYRRPRRRPGGLGEGQAAVNCAGSNRKTRSQTVAAAGAVGRNLGFALRPPGNKCAREGVRCLSLQLN